MFADYAISYTVKSLKPNSDYNETYRFCSWGCFMAWLIDDEKVLKLYAKRMELPREIRHLGGVGRTLRIDNENHKAFIEAYDEKEQSIVATETIEMLNLYENESDYKELDKEEREALAAASVEE